MNDATLHPFDRATRLAANADGSLTGRFDPAYAHAVGPFGGITAATLLNAALVHPARLGTPVALTVNYAGPVTEGEFRIDAVPVRTNRSTQHWSITLTQGGEVSTTASAVFALRRETWTATDAGFPEVPPPAEVPRLPTEKLTPWFRNYDIRLVRGRPIDTSRPAEELDSLTQFWIRDEPARPLDFASLAAICDAFFPRIFVRRPLWVAAGTCGSHHLLPRRRGAARYPGRAPGAGPGTRVALRPRLSRPVGRDLERPGRAARDQSPGRLLQGVTTRLSPSRPGFVAARTR